MSFFSLSAKAKEVVEDAEKELEYEPTFVAGSSVTELADIVKDIAMLVVDQVIVPPDAI